MFWWTGAAVWLVIGLAGGITLLLSFIFAARNVYRKSKGWLGAKFVMEDGDRQAILRALEKVRNPGDATGDEMEEWFAEIWVSYKAEKDKQVKQHQ